jgi:hypothetical protein
LLERSSASQFRALNPAQKQNPYRQKREIPAWQAESGTFGNDECEKEHLHDNLSELREDIMHLAEQEGRLYFP